MDATPSHDGPVRQSVLAGGALRLLTIDRADKANALDGRTVEALAERLASAVDDRAPVAFTGEGRAFCGGFDLSGVEAQSHGDLLLRFVRIESLLQAIQHSAVATFALVGGAAFGAGADLAAACAYRIGSRQAKFRFPGFRFGVALGTRRLANLVGQDTARSILLEAKTVSAEQALDFGLLTHLVDHSDLALTAEGLLQTHKGLSQAATSNILSLTTQDTRDADIADLVRSLAPDGLHDRIATYRSAGR